MKDKEETKIDPYKPQIDESGIFDRKEDSYDYDDEEQDVFDILNESPAKKKDGTKPPKGKNGRKNDHSKIKDKNPRRSKDDPLTEPKEETKDSAEFMIGRRDYTEESDDRLPSSGEESIKIKHIFEIKIKEISNIPILKKIIKDLSRGTKESEEPSENKYIQDVFIKYIFPLDDEQIVSDYLEFNPRKEDSFDYTVSMHSYHTY